MKPKVSNSDVTRPYVISIDGDIPFGSHAKVVVEGVLPGGAQWRKEYINPMREEIVAPVFEFRAFTVVPAPKTLATPFVYGIEIEGDNRKLTIDAEQLAACLDMRIGGLILMKPHEARPYLTRQMFPGARVSSSNITRPWMVEIDGEAPGDSKIVLLTRAQEADGRAWEREIIGPSYETLPFTFSADLTIGWGFHLEPSSDGIHTPFFYGIAVEGDGRRYFIPALALAGGREEMDNYVLSERPDGTSCIFLKPQRSPHPGFPSAMLRLTELHQHGGLKVEDTATDANVF